MKLANERSVRLIQNGDKLIVKSQNAVRTLLRINSVHGLKLVILCLLFSINAALPSAGFAATYYVDPAAGSDITGNGSSQNPWQTLGKAKSSVSAGDTVNLLPGNYGSVTFGQSGDRYGTSWNAPIIYQNDPDSEPYAAKFSQISFIGAYNFYITISGFDVYNTGSYNTCVKTENASYVRIINCKAHGQSGGSGPSYANIFIKDSTNILMEDCEIYYGGAWAHAMQLQNSDAVTVKGCHVHDIVSSGIRTGGGQNYIIENNIIHDQRAEWNPDVHGSGISIHSHNTTIRGNIVYNFGNTRPIRFYQSVAGPSGYHNMLVENNLVYKTADFTGKQWWVEFIDVGDNCVFRNNTFVDSVTIVFAQYADGSGLSIHNNVITGSLQLNDYNASSSGPGRTKWDRVSEGNNIFGALVAIGCGYKCQYSEFSDTSNSIVGANFNIGVFFDSGASHYPYLGGYPYQLCDGSPAIDFGDKNNAPETDLLGSARVGPPDAGCYEYGSGPTQPDNQAPIANAGQDKTVVDTNNDGSEQIVLDGSASTDPDGTIVSYIWAENGNQIATGATATVTLSTGEHTIMLTVTDNGNLTDSDTITITVETADKTAPSIVAITPSKNSVQILFNEALDHSSTEDVNNYQIDNGISITQASLNTDTNVVILTTSDHAEEVTYTLTIRNISDLAGNKMTETVKSYIYSPNLVGYWQFNEDSGLLTEDSSSNANTGTLVNGPLWTGHGALIFDGIDDYVNCGADSSLNLTDSLTISACINPKSFGQNGWGRIVDKTNGSTGFSFFVEQATSSIVYVIYGGNLTKSEPQVIELNKWQHVAVVYDKAFSTVTFYVDGQEVGKTNYTTPPLDSSNAPLVIGIRGYDSNRAFDGQMDNVRVYNRALNAGEVSNFFYNDYPFAFFPIGDKEVDENSTLIFEVITQYPDIVVDINDHNLPSEPYFVENIFSWTPTYDDAGSYEATFMATQGEIEDFETITITVNNVNRKPVLEPVGDKTIDENATLTFAVYASDLDGDKLSCTANGLPAGASFINSVFEWTPGYDQAGSYQVIFTASDGQAEDSETIIITVNNINRPPVLTPIGNKSVNENEMLSFTINASDADGDAITYSAQNIPAGAIFSGNAFSWTPAYNQAGTYEVTFIASDGQLQDFGIITITVVDSALISGSLVGYWKFDELTGTIAQDSSEMDNNAALINGPIWTTGKVDGALSFNGINAYVNCGAASSLNLTNSLTISTWINPQSFGQSGWGRIVDKGNGSTGYSFFVEEATNSVAYVIYGGWIVRSNSQVIELNKWQHVTIVYNELSSTVIFYVNGQQAGTANYTTPPLDSSNDPLVIGIRGYDLNRAFDGLIDDVRVYNYALDQKEVFDIFSPAGTPPEIIIDNDDNGTSYTGTWSISGGFNPYGTDSLWSRDGSTYTWTFYPTISGYYDVYMWWTEWPSRSTNVPVEIEHSSGTTTVYINQQQNGGQWNNLGWYFFESDKHYNITITAQPGPSSTCADAVRFISR